jgi:hypothetical protein
MEASAALMGVRQHGGLDELRRAIRDGCTTQIDHPRRRVGANFGRVLKQCGALARSQAGQPQSADVTVEFGGQDNIQSVTVVHGRWVHVAEQ